MKPMPENNAIKHCYSSEILKFSKNKWKLADRDFGANLKVAIAFYSYGLTKRDEKAPSTLPFHGSPSAEKVDGGEKVKI